MDIFEELPINNSHITLLEVDPLKNINLKVFTFPDGKEYYLCFFKLAGFQMDFQATASDKITSIHIVPDSIFLKQVCKEQHKSSMFNLETLTHYQFKYGRGYIDIVAEGFTCSLIWNAQGEHILA